jgi:hypothetical protein
MAKHTHIFEQDTRNPELWVCRCGVIERRPATAPQPAVLGEHAHDWEKMHTKLRICRVCGLREVIA